MKSIFVIMLLNCKALTHDPKCKQDGAIRKTLALSPRVVVQWLLHLQGTVVGHSGVVVHLFFTVWSFWSTTSCLASLVSQSFLMDGVQSQHMLMSKWEDLIWRVVWVPCCYGRWGKMGFFCQQKNSPTVKCLKQVLTKEETEGLAY